METQKVQIFNLTPHGIRFTRDDGSQILFPRAQDDPRWPSYLRGLARATKETDQVGTVDGIPTYLTWFTEVEGLPPFTPGILLIVSTIIFESDQCKDRLDLLVPMHAIRDATTQQILSNRAFRTRATREQLALLLESKDPKIAQEGDDPLLRNGVEQDEQYSFAAAWNSRASGEDSRGGLSTG